MSFFRNRLAQSSAAPAETVAAMSPKPMIRPSWSMMPRFPAAASGPGVGGTKVCVAYRPVIRAMVIATSETLARTAMAFFRELRMTKPESQNTGTDTMKPMMLMVRVGNRVPSTRMRASAMAMAAPVRSRITPMIVPNRMINPMLPRVAPNAPVMVGAIVSTGSPKANPPTTAAASSARNGLSFNFVVATTMAATRATKMAMLSTENVLLFTLVRWG